jgi:hypothetical protein
LQVTYGIKADRQHLELLILKVLPLSSINSKIFLHSLVAAVGGPLTRPSHHLADQQHIWRLFVGNLLDNGYILPGNIHEVGGNDHSWVVNWPENGGFKDTSIFRHMQYAGVSRTINEIPRVDLNSETTVGAELNVKLANGGQYIVAASDHENIVRMSPGRYSVTESYHGGGSFGLEIGDVWVNQPLFRAIGAANDMLSLVKSIMPHRSQALIRFKRVFNPGGTHYDESNLAEVRGCGRLTYHVARLNGHNMAVTYKIDGRAIGRRELLRLFQADLNKIDAMSRAIQTAVVSLYDGKRTSPQVSKTIARLQREQGEITNHTNEAERRKLVMNEYPAALPTEPVTRVLHQVGASDTQVNVWRDYRAWHLGRDNVLCIESERRIVHQCVWQEDTLIVTFHEVPMRFFVTPLAPVDDALKHEELREGDTVLLCGLYLVVLEPTEESYAPNGVRPIPAPAPAPVERDLRVPQPLRMRMPEQALHFHDGLPELEARERGAFGLRYDGHGFAAEDTRRRPAQQRQERKQQPQQQQGKEVVSLEMVVNWLRVTGVETAGQPRVRGALRQSRPGVTRSYVR